MLLIKNLVDWIEAQNSKGYCIDRSKSKKPVSHNKMIKTIKTS